MPVRTNSVPSARDWKYLTLFGQKKTFFSTETYFRESWFDASDILGERLMPLLARMAVLVLKPEALAARKSLATLEALEANGFEPIFARPIHYNRHIIREIWRYQFSEATIDRLELVDHLYTLGDGLLLCLRDVSERVAMPASARLHGLKGASEQRLRSNDSLRSRLGAPNGVVRFLHVPDEPADIVREIGILFGREDRRALWQAVGRGQATSGGDVRRLALSMEDALERCDFCVEQAWQRIMAIASRQDENLAGTMADLHRRWQARETIGWEDLYGTLSQAEVPMRDILSVAAAAIQQDVDFEFHLIDGDALKGWDTRLFLQTQPTDAGHAATA